MDITRQNLINQIQEYQHELDDINKNLLYINLRKVSIPWFQVNRKLKQHNIIPKMA